MTEGPNAEKIGVLIGETDDLRQRIKQYISGTQARGNKYWREHFLTQGDVRLFVLRLRGFRLLSDEGHGPEAGMESLSSGNVRLVLEQLLVLQEVQTSTDGRWIVNRKL